ncbi:hypothetical protein [Anabaena azotica]|uniref:hypothetical protein n=1 Tax=Anabaena azotica TaxID=197653 RepID=UPI0039A43FCC
MPTEFSPTLLDNDPKFEYEPNKLIDVDSPKWFDWLESHHSFRFTAGVGGENSYRARKELNKSQGVYYWYAVKKVDNKLHKKYIGKTNEVIHRRLIEVAEVIRQPSGKQPKEQNIQPENIPQITPQFEDRLNNLEALVQQLQSQIQEGVALKKHDSSVGMMGELEQVNKPLSNELDKLTNQVTELTNELDKRDRELEELREEKTRSSNELDRLTNQVTELTNTVDNRNSELVQLREENQQLTTTIEGLTNQVTELTNTVDNRGKQLEELRTECDRHLTQINQLTADNQSLIQQFNQSPVPNDQLLTLRENFLEVFRKSIKKGAGDERVIKMGELFDKAVGINHRC